MFSTVLPYYPSFYDILKLSVLKSQYFIKVFFGYSLSSYLEYLLKKRAGGPGEDTCSNNKNASSKNNSSNNIQDSPTQITSFLGSSNNNINDDGDDDPEKRKSTFEKEIIDGHNDFLLDEEYAKKLAKSFLKATKLSTSRSSYIIPLTETSSILDSDTMLDAYNHIHGTVDHVADLISLDIFSIIRNFTQDSYHSHEALLASNEYQEIFVRQSQGHLNPGVLHSFIRLAQEDLVINYEYPIEVLNQQYSMLSELLHRSINTSNSTTSF